MQRKRHSYLKAAKYVTKLGSRINKLRELLATELDYDTKEHLQQLLASMLREEYVINNCINIIEKFNNKTNE